MKNNYSRGSVGGIILIVVGIILCCLLLGVLVKTYKNSTFSETFVPTQAVSPKPSTQATTNTPTASNQGFVESTTSCEMIISEPDDEDNVSTSLYFSGYLSGCGSVSAQMLIGSVSLYRYGTAEAVVPSLTIKARNSVVSGNVDFSGYLSIPNSTKIEKGVLKFKHFLPNGGTNTINRIVYF